MVTPRRGLLLVISGPAGSGKTTLCDRLLDEFPSVQRVVTTTTRSPREGEVNGEDYHFRTVPAFEAKIAAGDFYEWARVHGRYYGSERAAVLEPLRKGRDLLLNIDVQGAAAYREAAREDPFLAERLLTVFVQPSGLEQIRERLRGRGSEDASEIERRLRTAAEEMPQAERFDAIIVSGSKEADYAAFRDIYLRRRQRPR
jgi:guanylate kinase